MILKRGMIIDINLEPAKGSETGKIRPSIIVTNNIYNQKIPVIQVVPVTNWTEKKELITTNVVLQPNDLNGLIKKSIADCLQTRPIDYTERLVKVRGRISIADLDKIDLALKLVFDLN